MSSNESESEWSETSAVEGDADRIRRNDKSLRCIEIFDWQRDAVDTLDALKNNTVVKDVTLSVQVDRLLPENQEVQVKLSEVMKCNNSVESINISLERRFPRERLFAAMATSGGWSSIQKLELFRERETNIAPLSIRDAEHISSFIMQSENLRSLNLFNIGVEIPTIMETVSRTKVQILKIDFPSLPFSLQNGRRLATTLERCTCITELRLEFPSYNDHMELFQILFLESIPKMLGLKKLELKIRHHDYHVDQGFFDVVGRCIGGHQGVIEELILSSCLSALVNSVNSSIVGLAPALRRLKVIRFDGTALTSQQIGVLSEGAADCETLEEFSHGQLSRTSTDNFKAICQLCSRFPSLKRVSGDSGLDLREEGRLTAFLEMIKTSKTMEQVPLFQCRNAVDEATIQQHCRNNMMRNRIKLIRQKGLLAAEVPNSAWPLILKEFSDMPDALYYLLQQKHGAMIGPTRHGCKRKQDFD